MKYLIAILLLSTFVFADSSPDKPWMQTLKVLPKFEYKIDYATRTDHYLSEIAIAKDWWSFNRTYLGYGLGLMPIAELWKFDHEFVLGHTFKMNTLSLDFNYRYIAISKLPDPNVLTITLQGEF